MEEQVLDEEATEFIDSRLVDDDGRVGIFAFHQTAVQFSQHLRQYSGNRVSSISFVLDRVPHLSLIVENVAYFLRNYHFSNVPKPFLLVSNSFGPGTGTPREDLVSIVDQLVEAFCDNIHVPRLRIIIPSPPSPRLIHRLLNEKSSPRSHPEEDRSELHIRDLGDDDLGDDVLVTAVVSLASEQQSERCFTVTSSGTAIETLFGALLTLQGATKLHMMLRPQSVQRLASTLPNLDVIVPDLRFSLMEGVVNVLEGAAIYAGIARYQAVKRVTFFGYSFGGHAVPVTPLDQEAPSIDVVLVDCTIGREAVNIFLSRQIDAFALSGRGPSPPTNLVDDFLGDVCRGQPSLCALSLEGTELSIDEIPSLCDLLTSSDCRISNLGIGGDASNGSAVLTSGCIAMFFQKLPEMRFLKGLKVAYSVTTPQLANAVLAGVRNNVFLKCLVGLEIEVEGLHGQTEEMAFWMRCNVRGRFFVEEHLAHPVSIPIAFFAKVFHRCSSSRDNHVLFHFLRRLVPSLLNGLDTRRSRRRERQVEAVD